MKGQTRKNIRLENYDYSSNGSYFITICAKNRTRYFSEITEDTPVGEAALGLPAILDVPAVGKTYTETILAGRCGHRPLRLGVGGGRISKQNGHEIHFPPS